MTKENYDLSELEIIQKEYIDSKVKKYKEDPKNKFNDPCMKYLFDPNFFWILDNELNKKIEQEKDTRQTIFLVINLRNVLNKKPTSSNLLINSESGAGKDHTSEAVFGLIPEEEKIEKDRITPKVLCYLNNQSVNPNYTWIKKALRLEDAPNEVLNDDSFKVFSSKEKLNQTFLIKQKLVEFRTDAKPPIIMTSAEANPKQELLRRYPICKLDETIDQTKAIIERKIKYEKEGIPIEYNPEIINALKYLKIVKVRIPFVEKLRCIFERNDMHLIMRTHFDRFLDYIRSSTALYQYQREQDDDGYYLATEQDYDIGRIALQKTTSNPLMIPLTRKQEEILDKLKVLEIKYYSVNELEKYFDFGDRWLRTQLDKLTKYGFVEKGERESEGTNKKTITYKLKDFVNLQIPSFKELSENSSNNTIKTNKSFNTNKTNKSFSPIKEDGPYIPYLNYLNNLNYKNKEPFFENIQYEIVKNE